MGKILKKSKNTTEKKYTQTVENKCFGKFFLFLIDVPKSQNIKWYNRYT